MGVTWYCLVREVYETFVGWGFKYSVWEIVGDIRVTYFSKFKMACTEYSSDNKFLYKKCKTSLCYFILKTVEFFCRALYDGRKNKCLLNF
jgi:hypothetical protein